jgi:hypothetical protein
MRNHAQHARGTAFGIAELLTLAWGQEHSTSRLYGVRSGTEHDLNPLLQNEHLVLPPGVVTSPQKRSRLQWSTGHEIALRAVPRLPAALAGGRD